MKPSRTPQAEQSPIEGTQTISLSDRIEQLRAELTEQIEAKVSGIAKDSPGVPREVIRNLLVARVPKGCVCAQYLGCVASDKAFGLPTQQ